MLTYLLIGGIVWFVLALVLVLALAAAARKQVSPVAPSGEVAPVTAPSPVESSNPSEAPAPIPCSVSADIAAHAQ